MSKYSRMRRKRVRMTRIFREDAEQAGNCSVFRIHEIPESLEYGNEIDYYIFTPKDLFRLTVRKSKKDLIVFYPALRSYHCPHMVLEKDMAVINLHEILEFLLGYGIPYRAKQRVIRKIGQFNSMSGLPGK